MLTIMGLSIIEIHKIFFTHYFDIFKVELPNDCRFIYKILFQRLFMMPAVISEVKVGFM